MGLSLGYKNGTRSALARVEPRNRKQNIFRFGFRYSRHRKTHPSFPERVSRVLLLDVLAADFVGPTVGPVKSGVAFAG